MLLPIIFPTMKNQFINLDFTSFYVSSAPSAEGDFFFLERERGGFLVVADETSSPPDCSAAFSGVFDEGFFLVLFFSGAFGVAERTSSFLESFPDSDEESASDFFMKAFSAFSFNSEVSIAFLDFGVLERERLAVFFAGVFEEESCFSSTFSSF